MNSENQIALFELAELNLAGVAISAEVMPDGALRPVGSLWGKLGAEAIDMAARGLLRFVVVAREQQGVPAEYLPHGARPFQVLQAGSIGEMVAMLNARPAEVVRHAAQRECGELRLADAAVEGIDDFYVQPQLERVERGSGAYPVSIETVFDGGGVETAMDNVRCPRAIVLGPPGAGKSTFLRYVGYHASNGDERFGGCGWAGIRLNLEAWRKDYAQARLDLVAYLTRLYARHDGSPGEDVWGRWLRHGEIALLLDGLDEVTEPHWIFTYLLPQLRQIEHCPVVLTCREHSFAAYGSLANDFGVYRLADFDEEQRDAYIVNYAARRGGFDADDLIDQLGSADSSMKELAASPVLLSIICLVASDPRGLELPADKVELYRRGLQRLWGRTDREKPLYPNGLAPPAADKQLILEEAALALYVKDRTGVIDEGDLSAVLADLFQQQGYGSSPKLYANAIREELVGSGILQRDHNSNYFFLHLTIQEFLVAAALARRINGERGLETPLGAGTGITVWNLLDKKAWDVGHHNTLLLLTRQLDSPDEWIARLADSDHDDIVRNRLFLAVRCYRELGANGTSWIAGRVASELLAFLRFLYTQRWFSSAEPSEAIEALSKLEHWRPTDSDLRYLVELLKTACGSNDIAILADLLARFDALARGLNVLRKQLTNADSDARGHAVFVLGCLPPHVHTEETTTSLLDALCDDDESVRHSAADFLTSLTSRVHIENLVDRLSPFLGDPDLRIRRAVESAILSASARDDAEESCSEDAHDQPSGRPATNEFGERLFHDLVEKFHNEDPSVRSTAAEHLLALVSPLYLSRGWIAKCRQVLRATLETAIRDPEPSVRKAAIQALDRLSWDSDVLMPDLAEWLGDHDRDVRAATARAMQHYNRLGIWQQDAVEALLQTVDDRDETVRTAASAALLRILDVGTPPSVLDVLAKVLVDGAEDAALEAAHGLCCSYIPTPEVIAALGVVLARPNTSNKLWDETAHVMHYWPMSAIAPLARIPSIVELAIVHGDSYSLLAYLARSSPLDTVRSLRATVCEPKWIERDRLFRVIDELLFGREKGLFEPLHRYLVTAETYDDAVRLLEELGGDETLANLLSMIARRMARDTESNIDQDGIVWELLRARELGAREGKIRFFFLEEGMIATTVDRLSRLAESVVADDPPVKKAWLTQLFKRLQSGLGWIVRPRQ